eukprot:g384.t1
MRQQGVLVLWLLLGMAWAGQEEGVFAEYTQRAQTAAQEHVPCSGLACYQSRIEQDLLPWAGGISEEDWAALLAWHAPGQPGVVRYQIHNGQLYRQGDGGMFPDRARGVEYFLLWLLEEDGRKLSEEPLWDLSFFLNTKDWPVSQAQEQRPLPVFSFSVTTHPDIMYPAWAFWSGGPSVGHVYPRGLGRWDQMREALMKEAEKFEYERKEDVAFFRGSRTSHTRDALVLLSRAQPTLVNAKYTQHGN